MTQRTEDIAVICLVKGSERYVWIYDADNLSPVLRSIGRAAGDPELSFSWFDAATLTQKIRRSNADSPPS